MPPIISTGFGSEPLGTSASATTRKIIATISGTPSATVMNAARCPGWAARRDLPKISAAAKPSKPAISARSTPTGNPSSRRDAHARLATSTMLAASTATAKTIPLAGDDCAASIASFPGGQPHQIEADTLPNTKLFRCDSDQSTCLIRTHTHRQDPPAYARFAPSRPTERTGSALTGCRHQLDRRQCGGSV